MWKFYPAEGHRCDYWRYEVDGWARVAQIGTTLYLIKPNHLPSTELGVIGDDPVRPPKMDAETQRQWAETAFLTGALENYVGKY